MTEPIRHRIAAVNGVELAVLEAGDPAAPPVILSHGFPESAWSWRHQLPTLAAAGYHVIAPDQRAPIVPHEHGLVVAGLVDEAEQVVAERVDPVRRDLGRAAGAAVAPLVRGDDVVAGGGEDRELVAP